MLRVSGLEKSYGKFRALSKVSFDISRGSTTLLLGPNGAGKTTVLKCIMGLLRFKGLIEVDGTSVKADGMGSRAKIGYVPQQMSLYDNISVEEEARFLARLKGSRQDEIPERLKAADLWGVRNRRVRNLSHGMRQRLGIALALLKDPPFLIFDEPISSVDLKGQLEFQSLVRQISQSGKTLLIATHLSGLSEIAADAVVLNKGKIVARGSPKDLLKTINARDTLLVKVGDGDAGRIVQILTELTNDGAEQRGDWVVVSIASSAKMSVLKALLDSGCHIEDVLIQPTTIESEYVRLIGTAE